MIKTLQKAGIEGTYLNIIKMTNPQQTLSSMVKNESISPKVRNKTRMPTLIISIQHSFGSFGHINQRRKRKGIQVRKEVKLSLCADDMILYIENPKDSTRKLLELISEYSKVSGYKINTQKSLVFLYTNNTKSWLIGKDWCWEGLGQEEKGKTEDEMAGWHHCLGHEFG